ncbi:hypothetical protein ZIOFF_007947 [Zingiber officinale]|uniref:DUF4283 domain-containing protein n=1 Tax=Zingiber officinale TaxID=94328 RepID=A0A8J5I5Q5_ZINOF|nr:hypothetical protein ZIOFF_007947 [Zingiber officinale]
MEEEVSSLAKPFEFSLIGKFSGSRPPYAVVLQAFRNLGLSSFFNIRFLRSGYVFMRLTSSEDMAWVWIRGVWFIGGVPLRIFKWTPYFSYTAESSVVPVWIRFPDLPIHMFSKATLFSAASIIGKPIKIDEATADCSRLSVARVCVEIDLVKPKIEDFWIGIVEECYASGNNGKSAGWGPALGPKSGGEDLREKLNNRNAAFTEKVDSELPIEALDGNVQRVEKQVWIQKKGGKKGSAEEVVEQALVDVDSGCRGDMDPAPAVNQINTLKAGIRRDKGKTVVGFSVKEAFQQVVQDNRGSSLVQNQKVPILKETTGSKLAAQVLYGKGQIVINPGQKVSAGGSVVVLQNQASPAGLASLLEMDDNSISRTEAYNAAVGSGIFYMAGVNLKDEVERNDISKSFEDEDDSDYGEAVDSQRSSSFPLASNVKDPLWKTSTMYKPPGVSRMVTRSKAQVHHINFMGILEPFIPLDANFITRRLGFDGAISNCSGGDFNVISDIIDHSAGSLAKPSTTNEFNNFIMLAGLLDAGFVGDRFTWTNDKVWKRLDRVLVSTYWGDQKHMKFQFKLKRLKAHLKWWNVEVFGNIFENVKKAEEDFELPEKAFDRSPTMENKIYMAKCQASLFHILDMEEMFWKQKAAMKWFGEGEDFECDSVGMDIIPQLVSLEENQVLSALPSIEELKRVVLLPPLSILHQLEMIFAKFFWGSLGSNKKPHWISWDDICRPRLEGGLGIRRLSDAAMAFTLKLCGPLHLFCPIVGNPDSRVVDFICNLGWNVNELQSCVPEQIVDEIKEVALPGGISGEAENVEQAVQNGVRDCITSNRLELGNSKQFGEQSGRSGRSWSYGGHVREAIPFLIIWFLWCARNDAKHRGIRMVAKKIIWNVSQYIISSIAAGIIKPWHWKGFIMVARNLGLLVKPRTVNTISVVTWKKPKVGWFKLNADGCSKGNPDRICYNHEIDKELRGICNLDKSGLPYIRFSSKPCWNFLWNSFGSDGFFALVYFSLEVFKKKSWLKSVGCEINAGIHLAGCFLLGFLHYYRDHFSYDLNEYYVYCGWFPGTGVLSTNPFCNHNGSWGIGVATRLLLPLFVLISLGGFLLPHFFVMESMTTLPPPQSDEKSSALQLDRNSFLEGAMNEGAEGQAFGIPSVTGSQKLCSYAELIADGRNGDVAVDSSISTRFSISWSRILSILQPFATLFHWDSFSRIGRQIWGFLKPINYSCALGRSVTLDDLQQALDFCVDGVV